MTPQFLLVVIFLHVKPKMI